MAINNVTGVRADIAQMLEKIRDVSHRAKVFEPADQKADFSQAFASANSVIGGINNLQATSDTLKTKYLVGDPSVSLSQVLLASEKSKLAFQGLITVRNKCLEAYKDIMSMPV